MNRTAILRLNVPSHGHPTRALLERIANVQVRPYLCDTGTEPDIMGQIITMMRIDGRNGRQSPTPPAIACPSAPDVRVCPGLEGYAQARVISHDEILPFDKCLVMYLYVRFPPNL